MMKELLHLFLGILSIVAKASHIAMGLLEASET
jgi:hypothetical protein